MAGEDKAERMPDSRLPMLWNCEQLFSVAALKNRQRAPILQMRPQTGVARVRYVIQECKESTGGQRMRSLKHGLWLISVILLSSCGYNTLQTTDEATKTAWSEVLNQYQRRADLIPNLVKTVEGFAKQERDVIIGVTEARSKVGSIQATPELVNNPAAFKQFQAAQGELSGALSRLMVVVEKYPDLKSDQNFRDLQAQLEGTENRIAVARKRYIDTVQEFNVTVRQFPSNLMAKLFGFAVKQNFSVENEKALSKPPEVNFGK